MPTPLTDSLVITHYRRARERAARDYVEKQIKIMANSGHVPRLTVQLVEQLVEDVLAVTPTIPGE